MFYSFEFPLLSVIINYNGIIEQTFFLARLTMNNFDNFVKSTLKVTASEDIDVSKDLEIEEDKQKSIGELLENNNEEEKKD
jgi:nucleoside permease NupC